MRRLQWAAAVGLASAVVLSGCSAPGGDGDVEITVWARAASIGEDVETALAKEFPDYRFTVSRMSDIDDKLRNGLRANAGLPDVAIVAGNLPDYFTVSERFIDLTEHGFSDEGQYVSWALESGRDLQGRQIALPTDIGPYALFYRADMMEQLGYPSDPDELAAALPDIAAYDELVATAADAGMYACDSANSSYQMQLVQQGYQYLEKDGEEIRNIVDDPRNEKAFLSAAALAQAGQCANVEPYSADWNAAIAQNSLIAFIGPAYEEGILKPAVGDTDVWRVAATPGGPAVTTGSFATALADSPNADIAAEVAQFLASDASLKDAYLSQGLFPPATALYDDPELTAGDPFYGGQSMFTAVATTAQEAPFAFRGPGSSVFLTQFRNGLTNIVNLGADPQAEYDKVVAEFGESNG